MKKNFNQSDMGQLIRVSEIVDISFLILMLSCIISILLSCPCTKCLQTGSYSAFKTQAAVIALFFQNSLLWWIGLRHGKYTAYMVDYG